MRVTTFRTVFVATTLATLGAGARAQTRWTVDPKASLAWWQVNPHLNHLWATTCPEEPSWRPGEGRSGGWVIGQALRTPKQGYAAVNDTTNVPLYPRYEALDVCTEAVHGEVVVADAARLRGVRGAVTVRSDALITGEERRDAFARDAVLEATRYPVIRFTIDSVVNVTRQADTLHGTAVGVFTLRDVSKPMTARVEAWPEAGGLRVLAKFRIPAPDLTTEYGLSRFALGLGVTTRIWYDLFMGVDVVLRRQRDN
jgi:polyisoprenoid-binding protein YceI